MRIHYYLIAAAMTLSLSVPAQTLFTYGNKKVDVKEFTRDIIKFIPTL